MGIHYIHFSSSTEKVNGKVIRTKTDILASEAQALVNTVNCVGKMGKGLALQVKQRYPEVMADYMTYCTTGMQQKDGTVRKLQPGDVLRCQKYARRGEGPVIFSMATKDDWRDPSQLAWIKRGLEKLAKTVVDMGISSVALTPVGCGNGKLSWDEVGPNIAGFLGNLPGIDVEVYVGKDATEYYPLVNEDGEVYGVEAVSMGEQPVEVPQVTEDADDLITQVTELNERLEVLAMG